MPFSALPFPPALLEKFAAGFHRLVGLPLQVQKPGEYQTFTELGLPDFCRVMAQGRKSCEQCVAFHLSLQDAAGRESRTQRCFAGLTSSAVPVVREGEILGFLHTGHTYVDRRPGCRAPGRGCVLPGRREGGFPCSGACQKTLRLDAERYHAAISLLEIFAIQLGASALPREQGSHYPAIDHLLRQMRTHPERSWRLGECARLAGMHPTYFSEKFHQRTGRTLTDFLARQRVEKAWQLLRYTGLPISEVAFSSGFRSLSQFNRTFKKITGAIPSRVRQEERGGVSRSATEQ